MVKNKLVLPRKTKSKDLYLEVINLHTGYEQKPVIIKKAELDKKDIKQPFTLYFTNAGYTWNNLILYRDSSRNQKCIFVDPFTGEWGILSKKVMRLVPHNLNLSGERRQKAIKHPELFKSKIDLDILAKKIAGYQWVKAKIYLHFVCLTMDHKQRNQ